MAMRQFGKNVGPIVAPKAKTFEQLHPAYFQNKKYLYNVKQVTLNYPKKGNGITATRFFRYEWLAPLKYWNPDVSFREIKTYDVMPPTVTVEMSDGTSREFDIQPAWKKDDILDKLINITGDIQNK